MSSAVSKTKQEVKEIIGRLLAGNMESVRISTATTTTAAAATFVVATICILSCHTGM